MSFEIENRRETEGEKAVRLFEEIGKAGAKAQKAREIFKAETATAEAILGRNEFPFSLHHRAQALGGIVIAKAVAEIEAKQIRQQNMDELRALLIPQEEPSPLVTVVALERDAISRSFASPNRVDGEVVDEVRGFVESIGEFSFLIRTEEDAFNVYPTAFLTGETKVKIDIERPVYEEAVAA